MFLFQESIVQRFGFIHCQVEPPDKASTSREHQYIHATGTIFVLISRPVSKVRNRINSSVRQMGKYSVHADIVPSPHEAYITRHVSGKNKDDYDNSRKVSVAQLDNFQWVLKFNKPLKFNFQMGFLWSWNHMLSKRWRTNQGVDNSIQLKLLKDFREFCSNSNNRLKNFWYECWETKELNYSATDKSIPINK